MLNSNYSEIEKLYATNWLKADRYLIDLYKKNKIRKLYKRPDLKKRKPLVYNMSNQTIIKGGASRTSNNPFSYVYNLTGTLLDCFKLLMPDVDVTTVSIFNPSITQISKNSIIMRLKKIEKKIYKSAQSGTLISRMNKLSLDYLKKPFNKNYLDTLTSLENKLTIAPADEIYACVSRVMYYFKDDNATTPLSRRIAATMYKNNMPGFKYFNPDNDNENVTYAGSIFNKWVTPDGFWGTGGICRYNDVTMLAILKTYYKDGKKHISLVPNGCRFLKSPDESFLSPLDARIININVKQQLNEDISAHTLYIVGSRTGQGCTTNEGEIYIKQPIAASVKPRDISSSIKDNRKVIDPLLLGNTSENHLGMDYFPSGVYYHNCNYYCEPGWKQSITRMQLWNANNELFGTSFDNDYQGMQWFNEAPSIQNSLLNVASWYPNLEKNFVGFYFNTENKKRFFCKEKCLIMQYHVVAKYVQNNTTNYGMAFYYKEFDAEKDNDIYAGKQIETENDTSWRLFMCSNSDIFHRLNILYKPAKCYISCTTPFIELNDSLYAVGHIKMDIWKYMNNMIENNVIQFNPYIGGGTLEKLNAKQTPLIDYCNELVRYTKNNIINDPIHGINGDRKYVCLIKLDKVESFKYGFLNIYSFLEDSNFYVRSYLIRIGIIIEITEQNYKDYNLEKDDINSYIIPRNFHPQLIYFMFIYKINSNTLQLESFSNPFQIIKDPETSFVQFPMGFTKHENSYWISYGEGDCKSYLSCLEQRKMVEMASVNNNNTKESTIRFDLYYS